MPSEGPSLGVVLREWGRIGFLIHAIHVTRQEVTERA